MVAPGGVIAHRTPAQYRTVMVPQTVMVAPESVQYQQIAPQYAHPPARRNGRAGARILRRRAPALRDLRILTARLFIVQGCEAAYRRAQ